jgi:hypothetical protein
MGSRDQEVVSIAACSYFLDAENAGFLNAGDADFFWNADDADDADFFGTRMTRIFLERG